MTGRLQSRVNPLGRGSAGVIQLTKTLLLDTAAANQTGNFKNPFFINSYMVWKWERTSAARSVVNEVDHPLPCSPCTNPPRVNAGHETQVKWHTLPAVPDRRLNTRY